jgi:hypothetical protein
MARIIGDDGGSYGRKGPSVPGVSKPKKGKKPKKPPKGRKGRAPKKARAAHIPKPGTFHEQAGAGSAGKGPGASPAQGHPAGSGMAAHVLRVAGTGMSDVLLELVGEGMITLSAALGAWQRDQERVTNRAWRRPGGLARMGGL